MSTAYAMVRPSIQRKYDLKDLHDLLVTELEISFEGFPVSESLKEIVMRGLTRSYDAGRASADKRVPFEERVET